MIFTSYTYLSFLALAVVVHWTLPARARTWFLVAASYVFYCSWRWQYGFLLLGLSLFTWAFGRLLHRRQGDGRILAAGIVLEMIPLVYFKYSGFLVENAAAVAHAAGSTWAPRLPDILLPLGISFFTFQGVAYLVDVATGEAPFEDLREFLLFKAFWPQLIAGPIIRPGEIREQIVAERTIGYEDVAEGSRRILSGLFKKVVLADTLAPYVDAVFLPGAHPAALDTAAGLVGFALQIYFDFSAYSDIAVGSARLLGFRFPENFALPYAARSPQEFWNRWHMTLSRWIRDYVFGPLSFGSRRSPLLALLWLVVAMALCGLWHGAAWTFVAWGVWHGLLLVANQTFLASLFGARDRGPVRGAVAWAVTLALVTLGWVLFRSQTLTQAWELITSLASLRGGLRPAVLRENAVLIVAAFGLGLLAVQAASSPRLRAALESRGNRPALRLGTAAVYALAIVAVIAFDQEARAFVYFQF